MAKGDSKKVVSKKIERFFEKLRGKTPSEIRKIKRMAMGSNVSLGTKKKLFCKKCFSVFNSGNSEIRIKKGSKIVKCKKCDNISRWKLNSS
ncbi:MAG: hypothetical protein KKC19_01570 [Nanoarchaeota archaeon]|nr:hypothetical protein [Nanoarchaeota archaeon]